MNHIFGYFIREFPTDGMEAPWNGDSEINPRAVKTVTADQLKSIASEA